MTLWFSATAAAPAIAAEFSLSREDTAWLTMAVQAGFVIGTLLSALFSVADVLNARRLFALGCLAGAAANAGITVAASATSIVVLRFATGLALACVYPPGLKIAAGWFLERRGLALGVVVGALTIGSAFPHLLVWAAADVPWRGLVGMSSALALIGGALVATQVHDGPHVIASAPFDPRAVVTVVRNRAVRLATFGYLGHMWELYAMWTWISAFATASIVAQGGTPERQGSLVAFVAIASGATGCVLAGRWADSWGNATVAGHAMVISGGCAALSAAVFGGPWWLLGALALIWGFSVVADSAQFSALVAEHSPRTHVGTALTLQTCAGFLLTMLSLRVVPAVVARLGWRWAFVVLVPGPALGALAMWQLRSSRIDHRPADLNR
jgi:MFS family permease